MELRETTTRALYAFESYVHALEPLPRSNPPSLKERAAAMLNSRLAKAAMALGSNRDGVVSMVQELALSRSRRRPPPIYVAGLGGSGSHWLTGMMDEALPVMNLREAPIPDDYWTRIEPLPLDEQGLAIDCLHLSYALAVTDAATESPADARFVNSAIRVIEPRHREWDPECFVIYLLRDPRDQAVCYAFRKRSFRERHYPGVSDDRYIAGCAANNAGNYKRMRSTAALPDFVCRFEEMEADAPSLLVRLAEALACPVDHEVAARAARKHDAALMRSGALPHKGNLHPTASVGWRRETTERQKLILHAHLAEVVSDAEYPADECLGRSLPLPADREPRHLGFPRNGALGTLYVRREKSGAGAGWFRLGEARGKITVESDVALKLRVAEGAGREKIEALRSLPSDGLDSLCLAGNPDLDNELLASCLACLGGLRELDVARTAIGEGAISAIAALPELQGLSIYGTGIPSTARALRESLRGETIVAT